MPRARTHLVASCLVTLLALGCVSCQKDSAATDPGGGGGGGGGGQNPDPKLPEIPGPGVRGAIAYVRGRSEIRLVNADGSNDRRVWALPDASQAPTLGITGLAWRPDGGEIAFTSGHEATTSLYEFDVWAVTPDGSKLRKLTNPPAHADLAQYGQGTVTVTVQRSASDVTGPAASGTYIVYVVGAREPQSLVLAPGGSKTLTFTNVADLGGVAQPVIAMYADWRWLSVGADVRAGATVPAASLTISGVDVANFGASAPGWRSDGSQIGYILGDCAGLWKVTANSAPNIGGLRLGADDNLDTCSWDWGPTSATASQILHGSAFDDPTIYRMTESGSRSPLLTRSGMIVDVRWLPDGSGMLFVETDEFYASSNVFRHDFASGTTTQLTQLENEVVRGIAVSPDGRSVVLERAHSLFDRNERGDLWVMSVDGSGLRLLVSDGQTPSW
jgi:TolB protein